MASPRVRPHRIGQTIRDLADAQDAIKAPAAGIEEARRKIAECDRKLAGYRAALDAGADPATVAGWITQTEAEKATYALVMRSKTPRPRMSEAEIKAIADRLAGIARVLHNADPDDKADIFPQLGQKLTCNPGEQLVRATIEPATHWQTDGVRGGT